MTNSGGEQLMDPDKANEPPAITFRSHQLCLEVQRYK